MKAITRRGIGSVLGLTLACLFVANGGAAWAQTAERTYLPPFGAAESYLWGCEAPWCEGSAAADQSGALSAEIQALGAGVGRTDTAQAIVTLTHVLEEPATAVTIEVDLHVGDAYASVVGAPYAHAAANVALDVWPSWSSWAYQYAEDPVAAAESPVNEAEVAAHDRTLSVTLGDGKRLIPSGPIDISVLLFTETTTMQPHGPSASASGCASSCFGAGKVEAGISGLVRSLTVIEER